MTIFEKIWNQEPWVAGAREQFRSEVEKKVSAVTFRNWAKGDVEPDAFKQMWLDDLFEKYSYNHLRPYGTL